MKYNPLHVTWSSYPDRTIIITTLGKSEFCSFYPGIIECIDVLNNKIIYVIMYLNVKIIKSKALLPLINDENLLSCILAEKLFYNHRISIFFNSMIIYWIINYGVLQKYNFMPAFNRLKIADRISGWINKLNIIRIYLSFNKKFFIILYKFLIFLWNTTSWLHRKVIMRNEIFILEVNKLEF